MVFSREFRFCHVLWLVAVAIAFCFSGCKKSEPASPEQYMTTFHAIEPGKAYRSGQLSPTGQSHLNSLYW